MTETTFRFDRAKLHNDLTDIGTYLAELHYIDLVFAYMADLQASPLDKLDPVLSLGMAPAALNLTVEFGGAVPFRRGWDVPEHLVGAPWRDSREVEIREQIQRYADSASNWASCNMETIRSMIEPLAFPTSATYLDGMISPARDALSDLQDGVAHDFGRLRHTLGRWEGAAATEFADNFYHPFQFTLESQQRLLHALMGGLANARAIVEATQQSLMNVAHHVREALYEQLQLRAKQATNAHQQSRKTALVIAGAASGVASTLQKLWQTRLATASTALNLDAGTLPADMSEEYELRGSTADELVTAQVNAINRIDSNSREQYLALEQEVNGVLSRVEELRIGPSGSDGRLVPVRPQIVDGVGGNDWRLPSV